MSNEELRAAADKMLDLMGRLSDIERRKRELAGIGSTDFVGLAEDAERLSRLIARWAQHQLELARSAHASGPDTDAGLSLVGIEVRHLDRILADWREAELLSEAAEPGTPEAERAVADVERLRSEYHAAEERLRRGRG